MTNLEQFQPPFAEAPLGPDSDGCQRAEKPFDLEDALSGITPESKWWIDDEKDN
jgi:hypothetical protein